MIFPSAQIHLFGRAIPSLRYPKSRFILNLGVNSNDNIAMAVHATGFVLTHIEYGKAGWKK